MRKKRKIKKHQQPDLGKQLVTKIMKNGEESKALKITYRVDNYLKEKLGYGIDKALEEAIANLRPELKTKKIKLGGTSQLVPYKVELKESISSALSWLVKAARNGKGKMFWFLLAQEIMAVLKKQGESFKRKEQEQQKAIDSMAFASFTTYRS